MTTPALEVRQEVTGNAARSERGMDQTFMDTAFNTQMCSSQHAFHTVAITAESIICKFIPQFSLAVTDPTHAAS